ncbi:Cysteine desulfurase [hydrothermal vent metagenome]|uniref:Cysteine desulfurase n=1 Tax=hydrothermal vent metagenome TaxID=652676 RepID=A0A3B0ZEZ6_9ZZZZ
MPVYLDHNATTPIDERVFEAMLPYLKGSCYGNPSSQHRQGRESQRALQHARAQVAMLVGVQPRQVVFTSGGTEANNLALKGMMAAVDAGSGLVVAATEHSSVLEAASALQCAGYPLVFAGVDDDGVVSPAEFEQVLAEHKTALVSVMLANNETGVVQDVMQLSEIARRRGVMMHTDAVQALGKMDVDFDALGVSAMSLSAHKIGGPKGVGALVVEKGLMLQPMMHGGGHEGGLRAGTENLAGIVGFGAAAALIQPDLDTRTEHCEQLRDQTEQALQKIAGVVVFAQQAKRLPNTIFFAVEGIEGATLLMSLDRDGIAVSSGSACASGSGEPSHVLKAMGVDDSLAHGAVRVSFGSGNTMKDVERLVSTLQKQIENLLKLNSGWR